MSIIGPFLFGFLLFIIPISMLIIGIILLIVGLVAKEKKVGCIVACFWNVYICCIVCKIFT